MRDYHRNILREESAVRNYPRNDKSGAVHSLTLSGVNLYNRQARLRLHRLRVMREDPVVQAKLLRIAAGAKECLACPRQQIEGRGLCRHCYDLAYHAIRRQETSWRELERYGEALPPGRDGRRVAKERAAYRQRRKGAI
jgi:hypothetical protein